LIVLRRRRVPLPRARRAGTKSSRRLRRGEKASPSLAFWLALVRRDGQCRCVWRRGEAAEEEKEEDKDEWEEGAEALRKAGIVEAAAARSNCRSATKRRRTRGWRKRRVLFLDRDASLILAMASPAALGGGGVEIEVKRGSDRET